MHKSLSLKFCSLMIVFLSSAFFYPHHLMAVTGNPKPVQYAQADGTTITLLLKGDELIHWAETTDGFTVIPNKEGTYEYAITDSKGDLVFSGVTAHNAGSRSPVEMDFVRKLKRGIFFGQKQVSEMKAFKASGTNKAPGATLMGGFPTTGTRKLLLILANFSNTSTTYSQNDFNNYMNQENYNGTGSFRDYYLEVSYGQLTVNTTVTVWVTVPNTHDYYGGSQMEWFEFVHDAVVAADNQANINFSEFDNNNDGYVDGIAVIHQGTGQESSGNPLDIWSHNFNLGAVYQTPQLTFDGVIVGPYTIEPEIVYSGMSTIGVMCHEFGHNLGAPDFYDVDYNTGGQYEGTGQWDLMAGGSWNGNSGDKPAHPNSWIKNYFNWISPTIITDQQQITLRNPRLYPDFVRYNTTSPNEYFLCENRQQTGFDVGLPGHGMIIYHVDGNYINDHMSTNNINNDSHQGMYPVAANATNSSGVSVSSSSTINTTGCPWPGTSNKTTFTDATTPGSKSWAGANTNKPLLNITENTSTKEISFCFISCSSSDDPTNFTATAVSGSQINLTWGLNSSNNPVVVAYSTTGTFGTPVNGTAYTAGNTIPGGGTVIYNGSAASFNHTSLNSSTTYYYKAWSVLTGTSYSTGAISSATTFCGTLSVPFSENFNGSDIAPCWSTQCVGTGVADNWTLEATNFAGGSPNEMMSTYQNISSGTTRLVTPPINTVGYSQLNLSFRHMLDAYGSGATLRIQSSTDGVNWTNETWAVATTPNDIIATIVNTTVASNLNSSTTYIAFTITGNLYNYDYWYIDNVSVTGTPSATTWTGTTNNSWATASNWSLGVPGASTDVTIPSGLSNYPTLSAASSVKSVSMGDGASLLGFNLLSASEGASLVRNITGNSLFHLIASPVQNVTAVEAFQSNQNNIWIRRFDEPTGDWINLGASDELVPGKGYSFYMNIASTTATFEGQFNTGNGTYISPALTFTGIVAGYSRFNLLGNPYPACLDWDLGTWNKTELEASVWVWDATAGAYVSWNGSVGSLTNGIIPVAQGFFVKATDAATAPSVRIPIDATCHSNTSFYKEEPANVLRLDVTNNMNTYSNSLFIQYTENATSGFDPAYDTRKLADGQETPELWAMAGETPVSIDALPSVGQCNEVDVWFKPGVDAEYHITASGFESFSNDEDPWIIDLETGLSQNLKTSHDYTFVASAGKAAKRFKITFSNVGIQNNPGVSYGIYSFNNHIYIQLPEKQSATVSIRNLAGQIVYNKDVEDEEIVISKPVVSGIYLVTITTSSENFTKKVFVH